MPFAAKTLSASVMRPRLDHLPLLPILCAALAVSACGAPGGFEAESESTDDAGQASAASASRDPSAPSPEACLAASLLHRLGRDTLLIGADLDDELASEAPLDLRYLYLAGGLFEEQEPCTSCRPETCAPSGWWGCWQWDGVPPGQYLRDFLDEAEARGQVPMVTYYELLQASGRAEGADQVGALADPALMTRYLADWRFVLETLGDRRALLHLEPDLWGYAQGVSEDPRAIPAAVRAANPRDCGDFDDDVAGLARCMIRMARRYAPNALVGLHASSWATGVDAFQNRDPALDLVADAGRTAAFLEALGAREGDFVALDPSDRDAGYYQRLGQDRWWDAGNRTLPHFGQAFGWTRALTRSLGLPGLWWQVPLGNSALADRPTEWKDNRVEYLFDHLDEAANAGLFGLAFGAGAGDQTNPSTDGGLFVEKVREQAAAGGQPACR